MAGGAGRVGARRNHHRQRGKFVHEAHCVFDGTLNLQAADGRRIHFVCWTDKVRDPSRGGRRMCAALVEPRRKQFPGIAGNWFVPKPKTLPARAGVAALEKRRRQLTGVAVYWYAVPLSRPGKATVRRSPRHRRNARRSTTAPLAWGQQSKWALVQLCKGQTVTARIKPELSYDRMVAEFFLPDGRDLGAELVRRGLALDWPKFSGGKYRHLEPADARRKLWLAQARQRGLLRMQDD